MRCSECGEAYPSKYYFVNEGMPDAVCVTCSKLPSDERERRGRQQQQSVPPPAVSSSPAPSSGPRRGLLVYLIAAWYLLTGISSLAATGMLMLNREQLPPALQREIGTVGVVDSLASASIIAALVVGAIALLMMRRVALYAFTTALLLNVVPLLRNLLVRGYLVAGGVIGLAGYTFGVALLCAVIAYTRYLSRVGRIR